MFKYKEFSLLYLNIILGLDAPTRKLALKKVTKENKIKIFKSIPTLTKVLNLGLLEDYESRVQKRNDHIVKYPDSVFWDYFEYQSEKKGLVSLRNVKVSTKGDIVTLDEQGRLFTIAADDKSKDSSYKFITRSGSCYGVHRAVGSIFKPRPPELKTTRFENLQVNHKDKIRYNNNVKNIEWVTKVGNIRHSLGYDNYRDYDHLSFTVLADNGYKDFKFVLSKAEIEKYFSKDEAARCLRDRTGNHIGFKIEPISGGLQNNHWGIPKKIKELLLRNRNYFLPDIKPIIGVILKGPNKGLKFSLFGKSEVNKYFDQGAVSNICAGRRKTYKGCTFYYASHREAIPLHGKLTDEIWRNCIR